ncbi:MAG: molybdenum cofactor guanylyltransferase MobA [Pseudomonadota bacterium]|nr:molybdenum cofactor guanylyltransferase MobA [Pseudomonadota bacterium]
MPDAIDSTTGLILAGGRGARMGGEDKGLLLHRGRPLVTWVGQRLRPQVRRLMVACNRNLDRYSALADEAFCDPLAGHQGPLAGIAAGFTRCTSEFMLVVPCDAPNLPLDLAARLHAALGQAPLAIAHDGGRIQPLFALLRLDLAPALDAHLAAGGRRVTEWAAQQAPALADFSDQPKAFANLNRPRDLVRWSAPQDH